MCMSQNENVATTTIVLYVGTLRVAETVIDKAHCL